MRRLTSARCCARLMCMPTPFWASEQAIDHVAPGELVVGVGIRCTSTALGVLRLRASWSIFYPLPPPAFAQRSQACQLLRGAPSVLPIRLPLVSHGEELKSRASKWNGAILRGAGWVHHFAASSPPTLAQRLQACQLRRRAQIVLSIMLQLVREPHTGTGPAHAAI